MTAFRPKISQRGDVVVAELKGEFDVANTLDFADELLRHVPGDAVGLVIDLSAVRYVDSAAVRMLFEVSRRLATSRQGLALCLPESSPLRRLIDITGLASAALILPTCDAAIDGLRASADDRI